MGIQAGYVTEYKRLCVPLFCRQPALVCRRVLAACACSVCLQRAAGRARLLTVGDSWPAAPLAALMLQTTGVCLEGEAAGDKACEEGHEGPLCDVCLPDWFKFSGQCRCVVD